MTAITYDFAIVGAGIVGLATAYAHFTRTIHGEVEAGPNAVFAFAREGYSMGRVNLSDLVGTLAFPGFRKVARKWWRSGAFEIYR
ncbi:MAG: hypothetical protein KatS3mg053_1220 [Candidatus Roseilinea sp.]|nr:MAG: hypothetical protein KatS3mg053_1220 [Candidatus Roseilinea sp.]